MSKCVTTQKGLFGQLVHYEDGVRVGESWPSLFGGSWDHYSDEGTYCGHSEPGLFADLEHYDASGAHVGYSQDKLFCTDHVMDDGSSGYSVDTLCGSETFCDFDPFS